MDEERRHRRLHLGVVVHATTDALHAVDDEDDTGALGLAVNGDELSHIVGHLGAQVAELERQLGAQLLHERLAVAQLAPEVDLGAEAERRQLDAL